MTTYTSYAQWKQAATARALDVRDETGYTEDLCAATHIMAYDEHDHAVGHCIGGPDQELDAVLCETTDEYYAFINEGARS